MRFGRRVRGAAAFPETDATPDNRARHWLPGGGRARGGSIVRHDPLRELPVRLHGDAQRPRTGRDGDQLLAARPLGSVVAP